MIAFMGEPGRLNGRSSEERAVAEAGERGLDLLPAVRALVGAVYEADAPLFDVATLGEMAHRVRALLSIRYPQLSQAAVHAVANRYAFDYK